MHRHGAHYLAFRDFAIDHRAYTSGKSETVQSLLRSRRLTVFALFSRMK